MTASFRTPVAIDHVLPEPFLVRRLIEANGPYAPVQRYFASEAEYRASSGKGAGPQMIIAPNFRGDWAYDEPLIEGVGPIADHSGFRDAACEMFDSEFVRPFSVYANITWQLPFNQGGGHTDVPEFLGISRTDHPVWLLQAMGHSRLFEGERIDIATAVAWFYGGRDGGFTYWLDGPDAPPIVHEGSIDNTAIVGDNDRMYHRVRPVGRREDGLITQMTLDARLVCRGGDDWAIEQDGETLAVFTFDRLRISVSWKARVFASLEAERQYVDHSDDLSIADVWDRFYSDLSSRTSSFEPPASPIDDSDFIDLIRRTYVREPTVFDA